MQCLINSPAHFKKERTDISIFFWITVHLCFVGKAFAVWHKLIGEMAEFYIADGFSVSSSSEYRNIGRTMCAKFPCMATQGSEAPWVSNFYCY